MNSDPGHDALIFFSLAALALAKGRQGEHEALIHAAIRAPRPN